MKLQSALKPELNFPPHVNYQFCFPRIITIQLHVFLECREMQKLPVGLATTGLTFLVLAVLMGWVIVPKIIEDQIYKQVQLRNGTEVWDKWSDIPIPVYLKFYIFNVTNPLEVERGEKPRLQQVGPYSYREKRRKVDLSVSEDEDVVTYRQPVEYFFEENMSSGSEDDLVNIINIPFVAVAHKAEELPYFIRYLVSMYLENFKQTLCITRTVGEILFQGYHEPMLSELQEITGEKILKEEKFGLYYPKNGTDDGLFEIYSGVKDVSKFGLIKTWNNKTQLDWWLKTEGNYCNNINGTDGSLYPPFVKKDRILYIFHPDICRSLGLTYSHDTEFMGIPGYRFTAPRSMLEDPKVNHDNLCFCPDDSDNYAKCLKAGAIDLSSCRDGAPVAMSTPHFYEADEEYIQQSIGIRPVQELHETFLDIEPNTGLIMQAHKRIQINVRLKKMPFIDTFKDVPEMLFPVLWADEYATLDDENAGTLKKQLITPLKIVEVTKWIILCVSIILICAGFVVCFVRMRRTKYPV
ncbi:unnamed protein product [Allacma fusca]|uniref:Scavenger receptor class B member 1 n=1 Tax=Allacma fusca TaxID=39272 RepID=A0A8J2PYY3_9HEXA|nr:unnamed protein product [Allacma fusca]